MRLQSKLKKNGLNKRVGQNFSNTLSLGPLLKKNILGPELDESNVVDNVFPRDKVVLVHDHPLHQGQGLERVALEIRNTKNT